MAGDKKMSDILIGVKKINFQQQPTIPETMSHHDGIKELKESLNQQAEVVKIAKNRKNRKFQSSNNNNEVQSVDRNRKKIEVLPKLEFDEKL